MEIHDAFSYSLTGQDYSLAPGASMDLLPPGTGGAGTVPAGAYHGDFLYALSAPVEAARSYGSSDILSAAEALTSPAGDYSPAGEYFVYNTLPDQKNEVQKVLQSFTAGVTISTNTVQGTVNSIRKMMERRTSNFRQRMNDLLFVALKLNGANEKVKDFYRSKVGGEDDGEDGEEVRANTVYTLMNNLKLESIINRKYQRKEETGGPSDGRACDDNAAMGSTPSEASAMHRRKLQKRKKEEQKRKKKQKRGGGGRK